MFSFCLGPSLRLQGALVYLSKRERGRELQCIGHRFEARGKSFMGLGCTYAIKGTKEGERVHNEGMKGSSFDLPSALVCSRGNMRVKGTQSKHEGEIYHYFRVHSFTLGGYISSS